MKVAVAFRKDGGSRLIPEVESLGEYVGGGPFGSGGHALIKSRGTYAVSSLSTLNPSMVWWR